MHSTLILLGLAATFLSAAPVVAAAQGRAPEPHTVTLIELESAQAAGPAMIYRRATGADLNVIALAPGATVEDLSRALRALDVLRSRLGDTVAYPMAAAVRSEIAPASPTAAARGRAIVHASFLDQLRGSQRRQVPGFGSVKALVITTPRRPVAPAPPGKG